MKRRWEGGSAEVQRNATSMVGVERKDTAMTARVSSCISQGGGRHSSAVCACGRRPVRSAARCIVQRAAYRTQPGRGSGAASPYMQQEVEGERLRLHAALDEAKPQLGVCPPHLHDWKRRGGRGENFPEKEEEQRKRRGGRGRGKEKGGHAHGNKQSRN